MQQTIIDIKKKYGKNAIVKGMTLEEGATSMERNKQIGGQGMNRNNYDDIIELPHHVSTVRERMTMSDRAAQFSPFAALTGC